MIRATAFESCAVTSCLERQRRYQRRRRPRACGPDLLPSL